MNWQAILTLPGPVLPGDSLHPWFETMAWRLLNGCRLVANGRAYRLVEIEFYFHQNEHPDPFTHRDPIQYGCGRWYFHRTGGVHRGGSFKGLDLTFGQGGASGGILIRGLESADGNRINGPSLCVDELLAVTGHRTVAALDEAVGIHLAWAPACLLHIEAMREQEPRPVVDSARVGLSFRRVRATEETVRFLVAPYRFLNDPLRCTKGKTHLVLSLHRKGMDREGIRRNSGSPRHSIEKCVSEFEAGKSIADWSQFSGREMTTSDLCRLNGAWAAHGDV